MTLVRGCPTLVRPEEAAAILDAYPLAASRTRVHLLRSLQRVAASAVTAPIDVPTFARAAMDGFALQAADIERATRNAPVRVALVGAWYAGGEGPARESVLRPGEAVRVATGAPVPQGADVVVPKESARAVCEEFVEVLRPYPKGGNISPPGEDVARGRRLVAAGTVLGPEHLGLLAAAGVRFVGVYRRPRVGLVTTGDEVQDVGTPLGPAGVYNSGFYALAGVLRRDGVRVRGIPRSVPDAIDSICSELEAMRGRGHSLLVVLGGVSVGDRDFVPDALERVGARLLFWRVRMRPGKSIAFADWNGLPVFALSGNPAAALTSYELLVRPFVLRLKGHSESSRQRMEVEAVLDSAFSRPSPHARFLRGRLVHSDSGWRVTLPDGQNAGVLSTWTECNCLICVKEGSGELPVGSRVRAMLLGDGPGIV